MTNKVAIFRRPCLPEDEGRTFFEGQENSVAEAKAWIAAQKGQYFGPSDYFYQELFEEAPE